MAPETLKVLEAHTWPGNVRELQSAIKNALVRATADTITPDYLPESVLGSGPRAADVAPQPDRDLNVRQFVKDLIERKQGSLHEQVHAAVDRILFEEVLRHVRGNQVQASELLGISRTTFRARMQALSLTVEKTVRSESGQDGQKS